LSEAWAYKILGMEHPGVGPAQFRSCLFKTEKCSLKGVGYLGGKIFGSRYRRKDSCNG